MARYREEQIIAAAHFYYIEGCNQEEIAKRLNTSRVTVTRMLKRARDEDIVQISVKRPLPAHYRLSLDLEREFGLKSAMVVPTMGSQDETLEAIGRAGAEFLSSYLKPKCRIGVAWSRTVSSMLSYVKPSQAHPDCRINELAGTYLAPHIPYSVSWPLAEKLNIHLESIPVPVLLKSEETKNIMLQEEMIHTALANALKVDVALVGIGNISSTSSLARTGYISREHMDEIRSKNAVGDILMRYFDSRGRHVPMSFEDRIVSLKWEEIMKLSFVMAMAFGAQKIEPIMGALRGGIIHGLITDRETALRLLDEAAGDQRNGSGIDNGIPGPSQSGP